MSGQQNENTPQVVKQELPAQNQNQNPQVQESNGLADQANNLEFGEEIRKMLVTAGTLEMSETQQGILYAPIQDRDVYIKPDGLVYLSWIKYAERLTKAFTGTGWAMLPQGMPKILNNKLVVWGFHLIIKGVYCGFAIGEQEYYENGRMSYGEACEGAKSNALMRLCKALGIGLELWDKQFIEDWLNKYAQKKWDEEKRKYIWSLKPGAFGAPQAKQPQQQQQQTQQTQQTAPATTVVTTPAATTPAPVVTTPAPVKEPVKQPVEESKETKPAETTKTAKPAEAKPAIVKTPAQTISDAEAKKGAAKGGKKGKLPENSDFLKQNGNDVPMEPITDEDAGGKVEVPLAPVTPPPTNISAQEAKYNELKALIESSHTTGVLKMNYEQTAKKAFAAGEITESQKESLRKIANSLFVKLATQGK